ncbi:MAG: 4-hydroxythreonine-4-phosphate dehydrogenase PdxA [Chloroflexi bacterium]|nr:4-hydroxythreonine-4-phosphate dehydrogenase PdxA [Chloroflexota bacterium]
MNLPIVAITIGDACGVGPEVVLKALARGEVRGACRPLVIGAMAVVEPARDQFAPSVRLRRIGDIAQAEFPADAVECLDLQNLALADAPRGQLSPKAGRAAAEFAIKAGELAMQKQVDAIATAPLNKEAMRAGGIHYIGHTELYQAIAGNPPVATMLISGEMRVVHVVQHASLLDSIRQITRDSVLRTLRATDAGMKQLGFARPRLGVCGLNPHNGEGGLMGREEIEMITPAVNDAQAEGIAARGPFAADSIFFRAVRGEYDCIVAMFHDQGHIAIKTYGFDRSITVTLGLPFIRTSADHGTAFDIAGRGIANETSMAEAIRLAARLAQGRARVTSDE